MTRSAGRSGKGGERPRGSSSTSAQDDRVFRLAALNRVAELHKDNWHWPLVAQHDDVATNFVLAWQDPKRFVRFRFRFGEPVRFFPHDYGRGPLLRFAAALELGIRCGYLDLSDWPGKPALLSALQDAQQSPHAHRVLVHALRARFEGGSPTQTETPVDHLALAAYEAHLELANAVRMDSAASAFLAETHRSRAWQTDAAFLMSPEAFSEGLAEGRVGMHGVDRQVEGGLHVKNYLTAFAAILHRLDRRRELQEGLVLHADWAHGAENIEARLLEWEHASRMWLPPDSILPGTFFTSWTNELEILKTRQKRLGLSGDGDASAVDEDEQYSEAVEQRLSKSAQYAYRLIEQGRSRDASYRLGTAVEAAVFAGKDPRKLSMRALELFVRIALRVAELGDSSTGCAWIATVMSRLIESGDGNLREEARTLLERGRGGQSIAQAHGERYQDTLNEGIEFEWGEGLTGETETEGSA